MERGDSILQNLLFFVSGLALIFLAHTGIETASPTTSLALEVIGFALAGYAPIRLIMSLRTFFSEGWRRRVVDHAFRGEVRIVSHKKVLPLLIVAGAQGCVTPPFGAEIDLRKFQRLRAYCEFVQSKAGQEFPPLLIYTGRSQGYAEMLAQALGMVDGLLDLPLVIENGAALYLPVSKKMRPLVNKEQREVVEKARGILVLEMPENEFEPKMYMITINPVPYQQTIEDLQRDVVKILTEAQILESLTVAATVSAVDITPSGVNKLSGLERAVEEYLDSDKCTKMGGWGKLGGQQPYSDDSVLNLALQATVGIANSSSDLCVLQGVGKAYCSAYYVAPAVSNFVVNRDGAGNVINQEHIDSVIAVIEKECRLRII